MRRVLALVALLLALLPVVPVAARNAAYAQSGVGPWELNGWRTLPSAWADQGVAVVTDGLGHSRTVTRGGSSVPGALRAQGWVHIGDPDSQDGYLLDAYQGVRGARAKMFLLTAPSGQSREYSHRLARSEQYNNSFAAIAPSVRWFVSGGWGTTRRLLVFPMPTPNRPVPESLPQAGVIKLSRPVRDVQGCAFAAPQSLVCSTNDQGRDLFPVPRQLLCIHLAHRLDGHSVAADVTLLGEAPTPAACFGLGEVEGLDVHRGRLLLAVTAPCLRLTYLYSYSYDPPENEET